VRVPLVATIHDVIPLIYPRSIRSPLRRMRYRRQVEQTVNEARIVITPSQISMSTLTAYAGVQTTRVRVIHNGVSRQFHPVERPEILESVRHRYGLPARFAFWIGEFKPQKNLEFLLAAWGRVCQVLSEPLALVLAGTQEEEFRKIRRETERRGLDRVVFFPGFIQDEDLAGVYSAASVFVFPSLYEGFGLPPLEAMACGTPCVVSNSSALPEVTGRAAMLFNPTSIEQFVECMVAVMEDAEMRSKLEREGLRQSALFSWEKAAAETLEVYRTALA
jgi:glycosyltransferase involved in cell wall biosynthesis